MVDLLEAFGDLVGEVILRAAGEIIGAAGEIISEYRPLTGLAPGPSSIECTERTDESR